MNLPEDYNEAGALWEHLARHHVSFFNFGFGTEMPATSPMIPTTTMISIRVKPGLRPR